MLKRYIWLAVATVFFAFQMFVGTASAAQLDEAARTVPLNEQGDSIVLSLKQVKEGKSLFNYACAQCHLNGGTKTDPNLGLDLETMALATPPRTNIEALVSFMKDPKTFDGQQSIAELHPSTKSKDLFPEMRNLTDEDLTEIAGYMLVQPKVMGSKWGGGKIYY